MSEKSRRKRAMRLRGEKRVKDDKLKGLPPGAMPIFHLDDLVIRNVGGRDPASLIADNDPWLGRMGLSDENIENAGSGLQNMEETIYETDMDENRSTKMDEQEVDLNEEI